MTPFIGKRLVSAFKSGSSLPGLVETHAGNYIVKWNGSGEGTTGSAINWIASHLAQLCGIPITKPGLIEIKEDFIEQTNYDEMRDIISWSVGINLGLEFIEDAKPYTLKDSSTLDDSLKNLVFLFDVLLLNIDRTTDNPNILLANNQPYFLDFSAVMEIRAVVTNMNVREKNLLAPLREHVFYNAEPDFKVDFSHLCQRPLLERIVDELPNNWLPEATDKEQMVERLESLAKNSLATLQRRLEFLRVLPAPDPEAKRLRALGNRTRLGL